jgi:hypothetical protein
MPPWYPGRAIANRAFLEAAETLGG